MDYLPIQASAVPCERVFSSSAETDTKKRNHIKPELMEALQILKFALKKEHMNFTRDLLVDEMDLQFLKDETTDPLANMLNLNTNSFNAFLQSVLEDWWHCDADLQVLFLNHFLSITVYVFLDYFQPFPPPCLKTWLRIEPIFGLSWWMKQHTNANVHQIASIKIPINIPDVLYCIICGLKWAQQCKIHFSRSLLPPCINYQLE